MFRHRLRPVRAVRTLAVSLVSAATPSLAPLGAQPALPKPAANTAAMLAALDASTDKDTGVEKQIWGFAEVGYLEVQRSALLHKYETVLGNQKPQLDHQKGSTD